MRILFDQATPVPLRRFLVGHLVRTAAQEGWDRHRNGDLLNAPEQAGFDLLITTDKNMNYQQNLTGRSIAVILLGKQQWPDLRPYAPIGVAAIRSIVPGSYVEILNP